MLKSIITVMVLISCLAVIICFFERKNGKIKNGDFYQYEQNFDVLFFGTSHMITSIYPMELWKQYGITSYNMGNYGELIPVNYWNLRNALEYNHPKIVVVDVFMVMANAKYSSPNMSQMHDLFDLMPISKLKIEAIQDLLEENYREEFYFPFALYHNRWENIDSDNLWENKKVSYQMGADSDMCIVSDAKTISISPFSASNIISKNEFDDTEYLGKQYLRKIIELCKENEIEVLLVSLPCMVSEDAQRCFNSVRKLEEEYENVKYYDMIGESGKYIDFKTDFLSDGHLNSSGAKKTTTNVGNYLKNNYHSLLTANVQNKELVDWWDERYIHYLNDKIEILKSQESMESFLMLLYDNDFTVTMIINRELYKDNERRINLINNLNNLTIIENSNIEEGVKFIIKDSQNGKIIFEKQYEQ